MVSNSGQRQVDGVPAEDSVESRAVDSMQPALKWGRLRESAWAAMGQAHSKISFEMFITAGHRRVAVAVGLVALLLFATVSGHSEGHDHDDHDDHGHGRHTVVELFRRGLTCALVDDGHDDGHDHGQHHDHVLMLAPVCSRFRILMFIFAVRMTGTTTITTTMTITVTQCRHECLHQELI